jgi:hypothetical protein
LRRRATVGVASAQLSRYGTKAVVWTPLARALVYHVTADELFILYGAK